MRNMKRAISLLIALVTVAAFMVVPAFGANSPEYEAAEGQILSNISTADDVKDHFGTSGNAVIDASTLKMTSTGATDTITIDFSKEIIYWTDGSAPTAANADGSDAAPAFVSFDNGGKWSALKFSIGTDAGENAADFSKNLNKESTILLTSALGDDKKPQKAVAANAEKGIEAVPAALIWTFGKINARPKLGKFAINYLTLSELGGAGKWTLKKTGDMAVSAVEVAYSADKKTAVDNYWFQVSDVAADGKGVNVISGETKPGEKVNFLVRVAPTSTSAGSKAKNFGISTRTKAPTLKIDYKKGLIKAKKDMIVAQANPVSGTEESETPVYEWDDATTTGDTTLLANITKPYTKESKEVKPGMSITLDPTDPTHYGAMTAATEKKPASEIQLITVAPNSPITETDASVEIKKQTIKLPKGYEMAKWGDKGKADTKWKASLKVEASGKYAVRLKNTAKYNAKTNETTNNTISGNLILDVVLGKDEKNKPIVTSVSYLADDGAADPEETASTAKATNVYVAAKDLARAVNVMAEDGAAGDPSSEIVYGGAANLDKYAVTFAPTKLGTGDAEVTVADIFDFDTASKIIYNFYGSDNNIVPPGADPVEITMTIAPKEASDGLQTVVIVFTVKPQPISADPAVAPTASAVSVTEGEITGTIGVTEKQGYDYQWYTNSTASTTGGTKIAGQTNATYAIPTNLTAAGGDNGKYYYYCEVINREEGKADSATVKSALITVTVSEPAPDPQADQNAVDAVKAALEVTNAVRPAAIAVAWTEADAKTAIENKANDLRDDCTLTVTVSDFVVGDKDTPTNGSIKVTIKIQKNDAIATIEGLSVTLMYATT